MPVQGLEGRLKLHGNAQRIQDPALAPAFSGHFLSDVGPQIPEHGDLVARDVLGHGNPGEFDNAAFDGIHQGKVAHGPGKQGAFHIPGPAEKKRGGRQVHHPSDAQFPVHGFQAADPHPGRFPVFFRFFPVIALEPGFPVAVRLLPVAVVGLVIDGHDLFEPHQLRHDPLQHLAFGFQGVHGRPAPALEQPPAPRRDLQALPPLERMIVGDHDPGFMKVRHHVHGQKFPGGVIAVRITGHEHPQPVPDGDAGGGDQKAFCEAPGAGMAHGIEGLPGDEHGHDSGLSGARRHFEGQAVQSGIGLLVGMVQVLEKAFLPFPHLRGNLREPDGRFHGFHLAEKRPDA